MLKVEYDILAFVKARSSCTWLDVINEFDPKSACRLTDGLLHFLVEADLLDIHSGSKAPNCSVRLSHRAWREMASFEHEVKKAADDIRQRRADQRNAAILSLASAIVGALLSCLHLLF